MSKSKAEIMADTRRVSVSWLGDLKTAITIRDIHQLSGDEAHAYGGDDTGPMPTELLLASVASCMALTVSSVARKKRLPLQKLEVNAWGEQDPVASRFNRINIHVAADLPPQQLDKLVDQSSGLCYVSNTIGSGCEIRYSAESI